MGFTDVGEDTPLFDEFMYLNSELDIRLLKNTLEHYSFINVRDYTQGLGELYWTTDYSAEFN